MNGSLPSPCWSVRPQCVNLHADGRQVLVVEQAIDEAPDQAGFADTGGAQERYLFLNHRQGVSAAWRLYLA
jgi:hypothetical protein